MGAGGLFCELACLLHIGRNCGVVEIAKSEVNKICSQMEELPESDKVSADHLVDFTPPGYNVFPNNRYLLKFPLSLYPIQFQRITVLRSKP